MGVVSICASIAFYSYWPWAGLAVLLLYYWYMRRWNGFYDTNTLRTDNYTFIVTGAESGVGKASVDLLAARGGRIIMACKDTTLGEAARDQIAKRTLNENLEVRHLDFGSLASVRKFAAEVHGCVDSVDALILYSAPVCAPAATNTGDDLNTIMQLHHFGPFLLANLLLDLVKKSPRNGRIVFVSSRVHHFHKFNLDNLNCEKEPLPNCRVYCNAKLANILTANYLARILQGTGVTVNTANPGMVRPDPDVTSNDLCATSVFGKICSYYINIFGKTIREGGMTPSYVASEPKLTNTTGKYFADCNVSGCVASISYDLDLQNKLFEKSAKCVNLRPHEKHI